MPQEKNQLIPNVTVDSDIVSVVTDNDFDSLPGKAECFKPTASAKAEGRDSNTLNLYTLDFSVTCPHHSHPAGSLRFIESSPSGRPLVQIASHSPTRAILETSPQNHALTQWRDVAVKTCQCITRDHVATLYISDIPGTGFLQTSILVTRTDARGDEIVYNFSGVLNGRLSISKPASCGDHPHSPCDDPDHNPPHDSQPDLSDDFLDDTSEKK